ncbi:hypothetical protein Ctob_000116 [Chrysochromulina tobinii]|uniref:Uncharacterized protein n=1 Tax=Chrysochromulina tobinii TaxID=1460289 RepID=A0A0M0J3H8_9EUKA|nr:hypothetical protein Ctob_000116 [Chrysochromulina tobinii]|eukprot:KOO20862.1 hypothetical protein Ctob_000116 [Chrysochromulina sp. CCMP291]
MAHVFARVIVRGAAPLSLAARPRVAVLATAPRRLKSTAPSTIYDDSHLFPDQVLEEDKTGFPVGLPQIKEAELWKEGAEGTLLAERAELWWDDGTAEPEWFVDRGSAGGADGGRPWSLSTGAALAQLAGALTFIGVFIGGTGYLLGDTLRPAAPRWEHGYPSDMRAQFGLPITATAAEEDE